MELPKLLTELEQTTNFKTDAIDNVTIGELLDAATRSPSAGNIQPWKFIVVKDVKLKEQLAKASLNLKFVKTAPVVIVLCGDVERASGKYSARGEKLYMIQDTAYASLLIFLACKSLGLGCYLVRAFDEDAVREILEIPENVRPFSIMPIGYPAGQEENQERTPYEELTFLDKYGNKYKEKFKTLEERFRRVLKHREK